ESGNLGKLRADWVPAFAGKTKRWEWRFSAPLSLCERKSKPRRRGVYHGDRAVADLAHFHRPFGQAVAGEAERPVDAEEAAGHREQLAGWKISPRTPVAGDAQRQQHGVVAERGDA